MDRIAAPSVIAFIGLGQMGLPMVANLLSAGFVVRGFDLSELAREEAAQLGAVACASPAEAAEGAAAVITMLPNGSIVRDVLLGQGAVAATMTKGAVVIDMSSSAPTDTKAPSNDLAELGLSLVDAPVSGGRARAVSGDLSVMIGGDAAVIDAVVPVLEPMSAKIFRTGAIGTGHAMKAINNYVSGAGAVAAMEGVILGKAFGLDGDTMVDILNVSTGRNNTTEAKMKQFVLSEAYNSGFSLALMAKDIGIAEGLANELKLDLGALAETSARWREADATLDRSADHTEMYRYLNSKST